MPLPDGGGSDNPGLIDLMCLFVIPIGLIVQLRRYTGDDAALFFL